MIFRKISKFPRGTLSAARVDSPFKVKTIAPEKPNNIPNIFNMKPSTNIYDVLLIMLWLISYPIGGDIDCQT